MSRGAGGDVARCPSRYTEAGRQEVESQTATEVRGPLRHRDYARQSRARARARGQEGTLHGLAI